MSGAIKRVSPVTVDPRARDFAVSFGAKLVSRGNLDAVAAARAFGAFEQSGERYDLVVTRLGLLTESALAEALAEYLDLPFITAADLPEFPAIRDVDQEFLRRHRIVPIRDDGAILVAVADPFDVQPVEALSYLVDRPVALALSSESTINDALRIMDREAGTPNGALDLRPSAAPAEVSQEDVRRLADLASEAPVIRLVHSLMVRAVEARASDIHLEPTESGLRVRLRFDGLLQDSEILPLSVVPAVISRIKIMARLDIAESRRPQDGRIRTNVRGCDVDLRVATMPTLKGECVVLRILDRSAIKLDFDALGYSGRTLDELLRLIEIPNGMILVTGPTGSGKTTTLYAALSHLNNPTRKIFTIEDPIEYQLAGTNQIQVKPGIDFTFANALRSILRLDPDLIMVGEIRDAETAQMAVQAALTGHLVLSTLHTNGAVATLSRLLDMGIEDYLIASTLKGVLAQRLVRRLCDDCAAPAAAPAELKACADGLAAAAEIDPPVFNDIRRPVGCRSCRQTGFKGRIAIYELMALTDPVRAAIVSGANEQALCEAARIAGMRRMLADGVEKVSSGLTTFEEILQVTRVT
ncbi:MAG: GspE/PulE family protein [Alphaproteobacteria bacterium]|nr:GspE/PulE family protein [Alphaproteobacteria bacterium]